MNSRGKYFMRYSQKYKKSKKIQTMNKDKTPKKDLNSALRKTDECIARFKNGKERYKTSATFNRVVQMLVRGADPYEIIDHLCQMSDDQTKAFEQYIHRDTRPMVMY